MVLLSPPSSDASPAQGSRRCVPNLPGSLTRFLSRSLGIDATTAMRVALLYGDMEWQAGGGQEAFYSARDYSRRTGLSRNTVLADLQRLLQLGAVHIARSTENGNSYALQGLMPFEPQPGAQAEDPWLTQRATPGACPEPPPCSPSEPPPAQGLHHPWLNASATLEKTSKTQEKKKREKAEPSPHPQSQEPDQNQQPGQSQQPDQPSAVALPSPRKPAVQQEFSRQRPEAAAPKASAAAELLAAVLETYREHRPAEWPAPGALTLTNGRRARLQKALAYAGSPEALLQRLKTALELVPPWFRRTYPQRPDGSRRPAHQFVDLLFRSTASESDCGPEAWHLFAWSEAGAGGSEPSLGTAGTVATAQGHSAPESDLERAKRLFYWDTTHWCAIGIPALELPMAEKRRLTTLLEEQGLGVAGTAAGQYADPLPDGSYGQHRHLPSWLTGEIPPTLERSALSELQTSLTAEPQINPATEQP